MFPNDPLVIGAHERPDLDSRHHRPGHLRRRGGGPGHYIPGAGVETQREAAQTDALIPSPHAAPGFKSNIECQQGSGIIGQFPQGPQRSIWTGEAE